MNALDYLPPPRPLRGAAILALVTVAAFALSGCGGGGSTTTSAATITETTSAETALQAFFFRDSALAGLSVRVPRTTQVAHAALEVLLGGPPSGYETGLPTGVKLEAITIADGIATASFSDELGAPLRNAQAQIVATLMQFPSVHGVTIAVAGQPVALQDGAGNDLDRPATNADYSDLTKDAPIFVRTPARDSTVSSPVHAAGTADVFEATFQVEIWHDDQLVDTKTITATSGSGTRGRWSATLPVPSGDVKLVFYESSANDGSHLHTTVVPLHVS
jgi:hypothetical protein